MPRPGPDAAVQETLPYERDFSPEARDREAAQRDSLPYCEVEVGTERQASPVSVLVVPSLDGTTERDLPPASQVFAGNSDVWTLEQPRALRVETSKVPTILRELPARAATERDDSANVKTLERDPTERDDSANVKTLERDPTEHDDSANVKTLERDPTEHDDSANIRTLERECTERDTERVDSASVETLERDRPSRVDTSNVSTIRAPRRRLGRGSGPELAHPNQRAAVDDKPPQLDATLSWLGVVVAQPEVGAPLVIGSWVSPEFRITSPVTRVSQRPDGVLVQTATNSRYFVKPAGDAFFVGAKR